jgi:hypothetical protein
LQALDLQSALFRLPVKRLPSLALPFQKPPAAATRAASRPPEIAGPKAPAKRLSFFAALRAMKDNPLTTIPMVAHAKAMEIVILPWVLPRHRTLWDDPDPERFSPERSTTRPRFAYLPFGGGSRICIGAQLALTEVSLLVATIAQRYRLKLVPRGDIVLLRGVTPCRFQKRSQFCQITHNAS